MNLFFNNFVCEFFKVVMNNFVEMLMRLESIDDVNVKRLEFDEFVYYMKMINNLIYLFSFLSMFLLMF